MEERQEREIVLVVLACMLNYHKFRVHMDSSPSVPYERVSRDELMSIYRDDVVVRKSVDFIMGEIKRVLGDGEDIK
jgi:hypothetical protein